MLKEVRKFEKSVINDKLILMNSVHRQSTMMTLKEENIAQHSFFVAYYAMKISKMLDIDEETQGKITIKALIHDIPESSSSDIPSNVKHHVPGLKETLDKLESVTIEEYFPEIEDEFSNLKEHEDNEDLVGIIIKLADVISLIQFLQNEITLGNGDKTVEKAIERAENKIDHMLERLKDLKENGHEF